MLNFTFYSSANARIIEHNSCFIIVLLLLLLSCIILGSYFYFKKHQVWLLSLAIMLGLWSITGLSLYWTEPGNFLSDWINSAAAIGTIGAVAISLYLSREALKRENNSENRKLLKNGMKLLHNYTYSDKQIILNKGYDNIDLQNEVITDFTLKFGTENTTVNKLIEQIKSACLLAQELYSAAITEHGNKIFTNSGWKNKPQDEQSRWKEQIINDNGFKETLLDVFSKQENIDKFTKIKQEYYKLSQLLI